MLLAGFSSGLVYAVCCKAEAKRRKNVVSETSARSFVFTGLRVGPALLPVLKRADTRVGKHGCYSVNFVRSHEKVGSQVSGVVSRAPLGDLCSESESSRYLSSLIRWKTNRFVQLQVTGVLAR